MLVGVIFFGFILGVFGFLLGLFIEFMIVFSLGVMLFNVISKEFFFEKYVYLFIFLILFFIYVVIMILLKVFFNW